MPPVTIVLGAGASRGVSYSNETPVPSPLDGDFFDLLERLQPSDKDEHAVNFVLQQCSTIADLELRRSMERAFYTLHLRSYLLEKLWNDPKAKAKTEKLVGNFARAVQSLLRASHGTRVCDHHQRLLSPLTETDLVISFNYDLAVERALRQKAERDQALFGPWIYGFENAQRQSIPLILKLHGSSNWGLASSKEFTVRTRYWSDFDLKPGYRAHEGIGTVFPIFLPFWDKRIEHKPWQALWSLAANALAQTKFLLVWGYSLPLTDVKSRELFNLCLPEGGAGIEMCVIDPSRASRARWKTLLPSAGYRGFESISNFFKYRPRWWAGLEDAVDR